MSVSTRFLGTVLAVFTAVGASGCCGTLTPLAPGLRGSVGLPSHGVLTDGTELPMAGPGFQRYRPASNKYWGVPRLVQAIQEAAAEVAVAAPGGPPLLVGDLSASTGGRIPHHASHRSGRDVDLLLFYTNIYGQPIETPGFFPVGSDSLAALPFRGSFARLDVNRQWLLVRALLTNPHVDILWMFVSRDIEAMLVQHALALGEPAWLVWRATQVMHQPRDSAPHDDHVHMRVACAPSERTEGCEGGGPYWPWLAPLPSEPEDEEGLLQALASDEPIISEPELLTSNHDKAPVLQ